MSVELLDKTRRINHLLHYNEGNKIIFDDVCHILSNLLNSNVLVISKKGKVLGSGLCEAFPMISEMITHSCGEFIDPIFNQRLIDVLSTKENVKASMLGFKSSLSQNYESMISPVNIANERLGTLFIYRPDKGYDIEDIILCEYGRTIIGLEMKRAVNEELEEERRQKDKVWAAMATLSYTEVEALLQIFIELNGQEGILVASKVADRAGITRSVIVNALRKIESAGLIESRSSGMKGTYISIRNPYLLPELKQMTAKE